MSDDCTNSRRKCDCGRSICRRCSRCFERTVGPGGAGDWRFRCPSFWCRLRKRLRLRPLRRGDTPRAGICTEGDA